MFSIQFFSSFNLYWLNLDLVITEKKEIKKAEGGAELVSTAKWGNGMFGAHMYGRLHKCWAIWHGAHREGAL